jgi:hypothetical protein
MNAFFSLIKNSFNWILKSVADLERGGLSLSRITFILSILSAHYLWFYAIEITYYHFVFIMVNLSYILFKDKALSLLSKIMDTVALVKGVKPTPQAVTTEETKEQQLNG